MKTTKNHAEKDLQRWIVKYAASGLGSIDNNELASLLATYALALKAEESEAKEKI